MSVRNKRLSDFLRWTGRTQSNQPLSRQIKTEIVDDVEARVDALEDDVDALQATFASGQVHRLELELAGRTAGRVDVAATFLDNQVYAPVIATQDPGAGDDVEFGMLQFAASVVSTSTLRLFWFTTSPAPRRVRVNFIIGVREE